MPSGLGVTWMDKHKQETLSSPREVIRSRRKNLAYRAEISLFATRSVTLALMMVVILGGIFGIAVMKNNDMSPRISAGDLMLYYRLEKDLTAGDIAVFIKEGRRYAGRVVAKGGDTVEITKDAELMVNGSLVVENDIYYSTPQYEEGISYPVTLEQDKYFILCDYREGAKDSRFFGAVSKKEIKGKVITVIRRSNL